MVRRWGRFGLSHLLPLTLQFVLPVLHLVVFLVQLLHAGLHFVQVLVQFLEQNKGKKKKREYIKRPRTSLYFLPIHLSPSAILLHSYIILLQVLLLVGLGVLQVFVDGGDLPFLVVNGLVEGLQLLLDPLVPLLFGGELAASPLLGIQVCALLSGLRQPAIRDQGNKQKRQRRAVSLV